MAFRFGCSNWNCFCQGVKHKDFSWSQKHYLVSIAIETVGLSKIYEGGVYALQEVSLSVPLGGVYGLIGANGAGKTTMIRILTGILKPTSGTATVLGYDVVEEPLKLRDRIGVLPQESGLYEDLTIRENLEFIAKLREMTRFEAREEAIRVATLVGLESKLDMQVAKLSGGMKRRAMMARALIGDPDILFLDEPTTGIDVLIARRIRQVIKNLATKRTIILATHNMFEAEQLCDKVALIKRGRLMHYETPQNLKKQYGKQGETFEDVVSELLKLEEEIEE